MVGRSHSSEALRLDRASLFNTLIAFLLYDLKAFSYVGGTSEHTGNAVTIAQRSDVTGNHERFSVKYKVDRLILRHGTDRRQAMRLLGLSDTELDAIDTEQQSEQDVDSTAPLWRAGWWRQKQVMPEQRQEPVEFVPPATLAIATTFVSTLSDILMMKQQGRRRKVRPTKQEQLEFRITLHRLLEIRGVRFIQQIAQYAGTRRTGPPGRVIEVHAGIVGLACRTGLPIVIRYGPKWNDLWQRLNATPEHGISTIADRVHSMFTCPFFAPGKNQDDPEAPKLVSLVLFMDSELEDFFSEDVLRIVFSASAGFVKNLDMLVENRTVFVASRSFIGYPVEDRAEDAALIEEFDEVEASKDIFNDFSDKLSFKRVRSFDIYM